MTPLFSSAPFSTLISTFPWTDSITLELEVDKSPVWILLFKLEAISPELLIKSEFSIFKFFPAIILESLSLLILTDSIKTSPLFDWIKAPLLLAKLDLSIIDNLFEDTILPVLVILFATLPIETSDPLIVPVLFIPFSELMTTLPDLPWLETTPALLTDSNAEIFTLPFATISLVLLTSPLDTRVIFPCDPILPLLSNESPEASVKISTAS